MRRRLAPPPLYSSTNRNNCGCRRSMPRAPSKGADFAGGAAVPAGALNRQRFVHAIATLDADALIDGGWLLPLGAEESLAELVAAYRELPSALVRSHPGHATARDDSPPCDRRGHVCLFHQRLALADARVTVDVETPTVCQLDRFGKAPPSAGAATVAGRAAPGSSTWNPSSCWRGVSRPPMSSLRIRRYRLPRTSKTTSISASVSSANAWRRCNSRKPARFW